MASQKLRGLAMLTALAVGSALAIGSPLAPEASAAEGRIVYVNQTDGTDSSEGSSPSKPVKTLTRALEVAAPEGGRIVFMGTYKLVKPITEPAHSKQIILASNVGDKKYPGRLVFEGKGEVVYRLSGPTTFSTLTIESTKVSAIVANFNPLWFAGGVSVVNPKKPAEPQMRVVGGFNKPTNATGPLDRDSNIKIQSGTFSHVIGFSRGIGKEAPDANGKRADSRQQTYTGTSRISISGGSVGEVFGASHGGHTSGSTSITVAGGKVTRLFTGGDRNRYLTGDAQLNFKSGTVNEIVLNNVVKDIGLKLGGAKFSSVRAENQWASTARDQAIQDSAQTRTVEYDGRAYSAAQIAALKKVFDVTTNVARAYVNGSGSGSDCTEAKPCASVNAAVGKLQSDGGAIEVAGTVKWDVKNETLAAGKGALKIQGASGSSAALGFGADTTVVSPRDLSFEGMRIDNAGALKLHAKGSKLVLGDGLTMTNGPAVTAAGVADGARVTVRSGEVGSVAGITGLKAPYAGGTRVSVTGGKVGKLWAGSDSEQNVANGLVTVSGGEVASLVSTRARVTESLAVRLVGGTVGEAEIARADSTVALRIGASDIGKISADDWRETEGAGRVLTRQPGADPATVNAVSGKFDELVDGNFAYVATGGTGDGLSPDNPVGSISAATERLAGSGTVVVAGDVAVTEAESIPEHSGPVTLTTDDGDIDFASADGAALQIENSLRSGGDLTLQNLQIESASTSGRLYGMGKKLTVGSGVETKLTRRGLTYIDIIGGRDDTQATSATDVTIASGIWGAVSAGSDNSSATGQGGTLKLRVSGGDVRGPVTLAHRGKGAGAVTANLEGGKFRGGVFVAHEEDGDWNTGKFKPFEFTGSVDLNISGGQYWGRIAPAKSERTKVDGSFDVSITGGDFGRLTDVQGDERFAGEMDSSLTIGGSFDPNATPEGEITATNPLTRAADPYIFTNDKQYYFIATAGSRFELGKVANPADLSGNVGTVIFAPEKLRNLWSPEIHRYTAEEVGEANAGWYLYFSATDDITVPAAQGQRQYVLKALDGDNLLGRWGNPETGEVGKPKQITNESNTKFNTNEFVAGTSVIRVNGQTNILYISEVGRDTSNFYQTINMVRMKNPWTWTGDASVIATPKEEWEKRTCDDLPCEPSRYPAVVEGSTAVYGDNGEVYIAYAASGFWTIHYAIGVMKYKGGDPFSESSWDRNTEPVLQKRGDRAVTGTGTGPAFTDHDGRKWFTYQARPGATVAKERWAFIEPYVAEGSTFTIGSGQPVKPGTKFTMSVNPIPLAEKISGFDRGE